MLNHKIDAFLECDKTWEDAKIVLFGAPFDGTTSYRPGARFGSAAIRRESYGMESYSPYQRKDLVDCLVMDGGDLDLGIGDTEKVLSQIEVYTTGILQARKLPFMLGGEHLVTLGAFRAIQRQYPQVSIIHLDAHADLRDSYLDVKLSHACVMRRCWELTGDGKIFQFGIRSGEREEFAWAGSHVKTSMFDFTGLTDVIQQLQNQPVYLTVDLDVLDPAVFPGTGTPEAGGVTFEMLRQAVTVICQELQVVGCDVNELSPPYDASGISTATACKIVREMLIGLTENRGEVFTSPVKVVP